MKRNLSRYPSMTALAAGLAMAPVAAWAQDRPPVAGATSPANPAAADAQSATPAEPGDVVVTGSRLTGTGFVSPTPLTTVDAAAIEARAATNVATVLYELPSVAPAPAQNSTSQLGGNFVNLRGFGTGPASATRTLILVDGHRFVPTNNQAQVDTNVVPSALVERLDVVTGGASAAYGSDAVAGVVNIVLKKKLDGFQGNIQNGISEYGDAHNVQASLAWGTGFAGDRGRFMIAGDYANLSDTPHQQDRAYSNRHSGFANLGNGIVEVPGQTLGGYTTGGVIIAASGARLAATSPLYGIQFLSSTAGSPYTYGTAVPGAGNTQIGGDGGWLGDRLVLYPPNERKTLYARGSFDVSPSLTLWAEGSYLHSETDTDLYVNSVKGASFEPYITESARVSNYDAAGNLLGTVSNPLIPANVLAIMNANNISSITIGRIAPDLGTVHTDSRVRVWRGAVGLDGKFGGGWSWNAYYTHGNTKFDTDLYNDIIEPNLAAALDVVVQNGAATCRVNVPGLTTGTGLAVNHSSGCVVANPFGPGSLASAKNYVTGDLVNNLSYTQDAAALSIQGSPFSTWAGKVSFVAGGEYRREAASQAVSPFSDLINGSLLPAGSFQQANPKSFTGAVTVKEVFGEVAVPLLRDSAIGHSADLNGAVRYTDYSLSGSVVTWKVGGTYSPIAGLLFRGLRSRDIRAPSLFQLYGRSTTNAAGLRDINNNVVSLLQINVGNPSLQPEKADTTAFGATITGGRLIPGLSLSVDYYRIKLNGFIGQIAQQTLLDYCYGSARTGSTVAVADQSRCNAYVSGPGGVGLAALAAGGSLALNDPNLNAGTLSTKGIDFELAYRLPLATLFPSSGAVLTSRALATYVDNLIYNTTGAAAVDRSGDISGVPKWRFTVYETLQTGPLTLTAEGRYIGKLDRDRSVTNDALLPVPRTIPSYFYLNVGAALKVLDQGRRRLELYFNMNNALNIDPPFTGPTFPAGAAVSQTSAITASYTSLVWYDVIGRTYTVGARFRF